MKRILALVRDDRGSVSLEQVAITAGLAAVAAVVVAGLTALVSSALGAINIGG